MNIPNATTPLRKRPGVSKLIKQVPRTDMTPLVDLGFLLITFFVITTQLAEPHSLNLIMPKDGKPMPSAATNSLTILTGPDNKIFYYDGTGDEIKNASQFIETNWNEMNGIGKIIREKQAALDRKGIGRDKLVVVIKPDDNATYQNAVDVLDEMLIHQVKRYALVNPSEKEKAWMKGTM